MINNFEKCIKCAQCCISLTENGEFVLPLSRTDVRVMRKNKIFRSYRRKRIVKIKSGKFDPYYPFEMRAKGICPFLDQTQKKCIIYSDRPSNCRDFTCY